MMERRVKERLIGASLLMVLIVLIVPELLSGPKPPTAPPLTAGSPAPSRVVSVDLNTSKATSDPGFGEGPSAAEPAAVGAASAGAAPDGAVTAAGPPAAADDGGTGRASPEQGGPPGAPTVTTLKAQEPSGTPTADPSGLALETPGSGPKSTPGHRGWAVQLGSFASRTNADRLMRQVQARGAGSPYVSASGSGPSLRYRVRVGPFADRGTAERAAGKLRAEGHPGSVVAPAS